MKGRRREEERKRAGGRKYRETEGERASEGGRVGDGTGTQPPSAQGRTVPIGSAMFENSLKKDASP